MPARLRSASLILATAMTAILMTLLLAADAFADQPQLSVIATVNGQPAATSSDARPAQLHPDQPVNLRLTLHNSGSSSAYVSSVRFEGQVLDLPLFSYDTTLNVTVPPGATVSVGIPISTNGIGSQATGLIVANVTLIGHNGETLASQSVVTNVHGSLQSLYGLFGLVVLVLTLSSLTLALIAMVRHTLPENRWLRAVRFMIPGFGIGLVLTFTTAAFGIFSPAPGHWLVLLVVPTAAGLALGFLTPGPDEEEFDDYDEDVLLAQIVVVDSEPEAPGTGGPSPTVRPDSGPIPLPAGRPTAPPDSRATFIP